MICGKCGAELEEGTKLCPHCGEAEGKADHAQNTLEAEAEIEDQEEEDAVGCGCRRIVYDKIERDEKGLIKRDGFCMKGVNYGPEFDEENLDRALKFAVGSAIFFLLFVVVGVIVIFKYIL